MSVCKHVYYSGRVQGVGFRYSAQRLANVHAMAGYVRNLTDGRVELLVEGPADKVEAFLNALSRQLSDYIAEVDVSDEAPTGQQGFGIRY